MGFDLERDIDPLLLAEYQKPIFYPIAMVYLDVPDGELFLHSGVGELSLDGQTWLGLGKIGSITIPIEAGGAVPEEAVLGVAGPADELLALADDQNTRGRQVDIYSGCTTTPGGAILIGAPLRVFTGSMGKSDFNLGEGRKLSTFSVKVKSGQPARSGAQIVHSDEEHQAKHPGDTMFRRVSNAAKWAKSPPQWPAA
ncbi:hypothetical protein [Sulfitobacter sp.]|jgi:hypothetical protein|uniref:hypothetical protein n=1 Tax=Sulfitobacter sp. TaxID=1903071 RepID=UPI0030034FA1